MDKLEFATDTNGDIVPANFSMQIFALPANQFIQIVQAGIGIKDLVVDDVENDSSSASASQFGTFSTSTVSAVPIPAALPLFLGALAGLGGLGFMKRRRKAA